MNMILLDLLYSPTATPPITSLLAPGNLPPARAKTSVNTAGPDRHLPHSRPYLRGPRQSDEAADKGAEGGRRVTRSAAPDPAPAPQVPLLAPGAPARPLAAPGDAKSAQGWARPGHFPPPDPGPHRRATGRPRPTPARAPPLRDPWANPSRAAGGSRPGCGDKRRHESRSSHLGTSGSGRRAADVSHRYVSARHACRPRPPAPPTAAAPVTRRPGVRRVRVLQSYPSEEPVLNDRGQQEHPPRTATRQRREPERRPGAGATLPFGRWTSSKARRAEDGCACAGLRGGPRVRTSRRLAGCLVTATRGSGFQFCPRSSFPSASGARKAVPVCPARSPGRVRRRPSRPPACSAPCLLGPRLQPRRPAARAVRSCSSSCPALPPWRPGSLRARSGPRHRVDGDQDSVLCCAAVERAFALERLPRAASVRPGCPASSLLRPEDGTIRALPRWILGTRGCCHLYPHFPKMEILTYVNTENRCWDSLDPPHCP
ncbi:atherin-like [Leopardus geoffroyi]|uniref:atherin-like n=1 Tax=Leopardus geoffroyi TaxID=46844 RepID=UPI001E264F6C|nr:atherin-like [Leopardus geoffroyi]